MMLRPEQITLRPVAPSDDAFILSVYASTRAGELAQVPWTAQQKEAFVKMQFQLQKQHYATSYPQASHDVICVDETPAGRIYVDRGTDQFHILDITVLPQFRNQQIGSIVLRRLLDEAGAKNQAATIYVETFNPSLKLFERLGFEKSQLKDLHYLMMRPAQR